MNYNKPLNGKTVYNTPKLCTNETTTTIWQQIHLQFYTQYTKNLYHNTQENCPLCKTHPTTRTHIILACDYTNTLWKDLEPILLQLNPNTVTKNEMAFGLVTTDYNYGIILRNWITYNLRDLILKEERKSAFTPLKKPNAIHLKRKLNEKIKSEIIIKKTQHTYKGTIHKYNAIITHKNIICSNLTDEVINPIFET